MRGKPIGFNVTLEDGRDVFVSAEDFVPHKKRIDIVYIKGQWVVVTAVFAVYGKQGG